MGNSANAWRLGVAQSQAEMPVDVTVQYPVLNQTAVLPEQSRRATDPINHGKNRKYKTIGLHVR